MPKPRAWSDEQLTDALALAKATSLREAARVTGIPFGTLSRWAAKLERDKRSDARQNRVLVEQVEAKAATIAPAVQSTIAERAARMAEDLYNLAEKSRRQIDGALTQAQHLKGTKDPAWLRALVGVLAQSLEKAQLLAGKPTGRAAVEGTVTHTADVSQYLQDPEARALARMLFRRGQGGDQEEEEPGALVQ